MSGCQAALSASIAEGSGDACQFGSHAEHPSPLVTANARRMAHVYARTHLGTAGRLRVDQVHICQKRKRTVRSLGKT